MSTKISKRELFSKHALSAGLGVSALALLPQRPSADTPFTSFPFTATGALTARTMPDRLGEIKNVKDYGAVGDGSTDDTAAIQNCLNAAFSNAGNPEHNKPVFFPAGKYKVTYPLYIKNTGGAHVYGAGMQSTQITNSGSTNTLFTASIDASTGYNSVMHVTAVTAGVIRRGMIIQGTKTGYATGYIVFGGSFGVNIPNGTSITLNGTTVTFVTGAPGAFQVQIGVNLHATLASLLNFLRGSTNAQLIKFSYGVAGARLNLTATTPGAAGNSLTLASAFESASLMLSGPTLSNESVGQAIIVGDYISGGSDGSTGNYYVSPTGAFASGPLIGINTTALYLNGCAYSCFEEFSASAGTGGTGIDYDWVNTEPDVHPAWAAQVCLFKHVNFTAGATGAIGGVTVPGGVGCRVGVSDNQCDTSSWVECYFGGAGGSAGLLDCNLNAIGQAVIGGNIAAVDIGIWVKGSSVSSIQSVNFELTGIFDIAIDGGGEDGVVINGCSSEGNHFLRCAPSAVTVICNGCAQRCSQPYSIFAQYSSPLILNGCRSTMGIIQSSNPAGAPLSINNCIFIRQDALDTVGTVDTEITQTLLGYYNVIAEKIGRKKITPAGIRTYDVEGASLTDPAVLYSSTNIQGGLQYGVVTADPATDLITFGAIPWPPFTAGVKLAFVNSGGALPRGLVANKTYYVTSSGMTSTAFKVSLTPGTGGSPVDITSAGTGTQRVYILRTFAVGDMVTNNTVGAGGFPGWVCITAGPAVADNAGKVAVFKTMAAVAT